MSKTYDGIGVITIPGHFNYGNRLQCYATQQILSRYSSRVDTLEFVEERPMVYLKRFAKMLLQKPAKTREMSMSPERRKAFDAFQSLISCREVSVFDSELEAEYQFFVVGSDQVWNPRFMRRYRYPELLQFAPKEKSIALSASIGARELGKRHQKLFAVALREFKSISVREESASMIIEKLIGEAPAVLVDPTLMLDETSWRAIANDGLLPDEPYVLVYSLGDKSHAVLELCESVMRVHGATRIVWLSDADDGREVPAGPSEFLSLVANAEAVVTDSYHGTIFSIIFKKQFFVFERAGSPDMFSRLETLLGQLSLQDRFFDVNCGQRVLGEDCAIDYTAANVLLAEQQSKFEGYLKTCFSDCNALNRGV